MVVTCTLLPIVFVIDFNTLNNHALLPSVHHVAIFSVHLRESSDFFAALEHRE